MEALASGPCVAPSRSLCRDDRAFDPDVIGQLVALELDADDVRRSAPHYAWTGLEDLRSEVRTAIARQCRHRHVDADDIVQEALMRAARNRHSLTDPERLRAWVVRIGLNVLRDEMRRDMRLPRVDKGDELFDMLEGREEIPGDPPEDALEAEGEVFERCSVMRQLDCALEELPRDDRRVLDAYYQRGDPSRRASCVRESGPELFKVHVFRARSRLARMLRKRLALGLCGDALTRTAGPSTHDFRSARCAPVRRTDSGRGIAAGNPS